MRQIRRRLQSVTAIALALACALGLATAATPKSYATAMPIPQVRAIETGAKGNPYSDLSGHEWHFDAALFCQANNILQADGDTFNPNSPLTLSDCQTALSALSRFPFATGGVSCGTSGGATDEAADAAQDEAPTSYVNREQFVGMLMAAAEIVSPSLVNDVDEAPGGFGWTDSGKAILELYRAGILIGDEHGYFSPFKPITRAEAATILMRFFVPASRARIDLPFSTDGSVAVTRIDLDPDTIEWLKKDNAYNRRIEFSGNSIHLMALHVGDAHAAYEAVYSLASATTCHLSPSQPAPEPVSSELQASDLPGHAISTGNKSGISDGVLLTVAEGGVYRYHDINGREIKTAKPIFDATPFNEGYAAVRYELGVSGSVQIIDKSGARVADLPGGYLLHRIYPSSGIVQGFSAFQMEPRYPITDTVVKIDTGEKMTAIATFDKSVNMTGVFRHGFAAVEIRDFGPHRIIGESSDLVGTDFRLLGLDQSRSDFRIMDWNEEFIIIEEGISSESKSADNGRTRAAQEGALEFALLDYDKNEARRTTGSRMAFADVLGMPNSAVALTRHVGQADDTRERVETTILDAASGATLSIIPSSTIQIENCLLVASDYNYDDDRVGGLAISDVEYGVKNEPHCVTDIYGNRLSPILKDAAGYFTHGDITLDSSGYIVPSELADPEKNVNDGLLFYSNAEIYHLRSDRRYNFD